MIRRVASLTAMLAIAASATGAQTAAIYGAGLQAWTGCWAPEENLTPGRIAPLLCITPTANVNVAQVASIDGNLVALETLDATGRPLALDVRGCTGTRRATWSNDSRRLFLRTTGVCQGVPLAVSGIFSISASGEWLNVEGVGRGSGTSVRVTRYRDVGVPAGLPLGLASSVRTNALARESTRAAFGAPVHLEDVIDALGLVDADVVAAWIRARAQQFDVTQSDLARLDLTGLPSRVTDALAVIADSNAALARAADSTSYAEGYAMDRQAGEFYDDFVPLSYWGAGYYAPFSLRRGGGARGGHGRGGNAPDGRGGNATDGRGGNAAGGRDGGAPAGSGGTVRLGTSYR